MVVAVVVGAAACAGMSVSTGERPPQAAVHPASPFDGDSNSRIAHGHGLRQVDGILVTLPKGWTFRRNPLPALLEPSVPFAVGSWRFPAGGNCALTHAINAEPTAAALVWLYEYTPAAVRSGFGDFPPRPKRFRLGPLQGPLGVPRCTRLYRPIPLTPPLPRSPGRARKTYPQTSTPSCGRHPRQHQGRSPPGLNRCESASLPPRRPPDAAVPPGGNEHARLRDS